VTSIASTRLPADDLSSTSTGRRRIVRRKPAQQTPAQADAALFKGNTFQHLAWAYTKHIHSLTDAGLFDGHQAARTVMLYFAHHTARYTATGKGREAGCVLEGKISQKAIMKETGLSQKSVQRAVNWLIASGFVRVDVLFGGQRQYYARIEITSFDAESEQDRKAWLAGQQAAQVPAEDAGDGVITGSTGHHDHSQLVTMTSSTGHHDRVFNTDSYTEEHTLKSDDDDLPAEQSKRMKPSAPSAPAAPSALESGDGMTDTRSWLEILDPNWKAAPQPDGDSVLFYVGQDKKGYPYLAQEGVRSSRYPAGRAFVHGMDSGRVWLTPEQVSEYFAASQGDTSRWRELNRHYYELAEETDPQFRQRPRKRTVAERGREYVNSFWVQTEGERAGYFTRTNRRDQKPGEVRVELTPHEAVELFGKKDYMGQDLGYVENRTDRVEWMRNKLAQLGHLDEDYDEDTRPAEDRPADEPETASARLAARRAA